MLFARITLANFSVSSPMSLPTSIGEPANTVTPRPARHAVRFGEHSIDFPVELFKIFSGPVLVDLVCRANNTASPPLVNAQVTRSIFHRGAMHDACPIGEMKILAVQILEKGKPR
jgi:hypothetical protein